MKTRRLANAAITPIPEEPGAWKLMTDAIPEEIITTPAQLNGLVEHLRAIGRFAFDTEFVSEETFEPVLCLIQVATRERLAVIDPLAVRDVSPFWDVVLDPAIEVVMHAAGEDLRICLIRTQALPRRVFDVQMAAGLPVSVIRYHWLTWSARCWASAWPAAKRAPTGGTGR